MGRFTKESGSEWGRVGGTVRTAKHDPSAFAKTGQTGLLARFEREVDPDGTLDPVERQRRAARLRRAHMMRLSAFAARARKANAQARREAAERTANTDGGAA